MLLPCGVGSAESGSLAIETRTCVHQKLSAAPVSDGTLRRIVLSRLASWALAYNNAPVAMVKTVLGRNAMRCGALSRPADAPVARMLQPWYPAECLKLRRASQSPTALEQRIAGLYQGCRCCFQSSPLKRIVCHITGRASELDTTMPRVVSVLRDAPALLLLPCLLCRCRCEPADLRDSIALSTSA